MTAQNIWKVDKGEMYRQKRRAQATAFYLKARSQDLIIDIGSGEGFIVSYYPKVNFLVALEPAKEAILIAKHQLKRTNVHFVNADAEALPLKNASVDKATLLEVLEHLNEEKQKKLCVEVNRILKEKGILIISVPYKEKIAYTQCIHCQKLTPFWGHLCSMDENKVGNLLPFYYTLLAMVHLPNIPLLSLSEIFSHLPFRIWFLFNNLFGKFRKGYWLLLKYRKENRQKMTQGV